MAVRDALLHALVRPRAVEVRHVLAQDAAQVGLAQDEDMVETLAPDTAEEPLADAVLSGGAVGGPQDGDAARLSDSGEGWPVLAVVVANEVLRGKCQNSANVKIWELILPTRTLDRGYHGTGSIEIAAIGPILPHFSSRSTRSRLIGTEV